MCRQYVLAAVLAALAVSAQGQNCPADGYVLSGSSSLGTRNTFPYEGGVTRARIQPPQGCPWLVTPASVPSWISILSASSGFDTQIVEIGVETNTTTTARVAELLIGGRRFPITQAAAPAACTLSLQTPSANAPATGGIAQNRLNSTPGTCKWVGFSDRKWLQMYPIDGTGSANFAVTVFPNFSTAQRTGTSNIGGQKLSVLQSASTGTYHERLVRLLYFNFLGRLPSASEVAFHVHSLNNGLAPADLALNFMNTDEFNLVGRFIAGIYVGILVRDAEFGGWLFQRNAVSTGVVPLSSLVTNFIGSQEYAAKFGNPTNADFVRLLYQFILLRQATDSEVQGQVNALTSGTSRAQLASNFLNSPEFRNGRGPRLTAFILYATLLSRDPSPLELPARVQQIETGTAVRTLIQDIMSSTEFITGLN